MGEIYIIYKKKFPPPHKRMQISMLVQKKIIIFNNILHFHANSADAESYLYANAFECL